MKSRWFVAPVLCVAVAIAVVLMFTSMKKQSVLALRTNMLAAARRYPNFTRAQRLAVLREWQSETHPMFRDLSTAEAVRRMIAAAVSSSANPQAPNANFFGNVTAINIDHTDLLGLERTANCSLTMVSASYSLSLPSFTYTVLGTTANYDQTLHNEAQLKTKGGSWPAGCGDPVIGIPSRKAGYIGLTKGGFKVYAEAFYDGATGANDVETVVANASTDAAVSSDLITSLPNPRARRPFRCCWEILTGRLGTRPTTRCRGKRRRASSLMTSMGMESSTSLPPARLFRRERRRIRFRSSKARAMATLRLRSQ
jgi:hypothetical protein